MPVSLVHPRLQPQEFVLTSDRPHWNANTFGGTSFGVHPDSTVARDKEGNAVSVALELEIAGERRHFSVRLNEPSSQRDDQVILKNIAKVIALNLGQTRLAAGASLRINRDGTSAVREANGTLVENERRRVSTRSGLVSISGEQTPVVKQRDSVAKTASYLAKALNTPKPSVTTGSTANGAPPPLASTTIVQAPVLALGALVERLSKKWPKVDKDGKALPPDFYPEDFIAAAQEADGHKFTLLANLIDERYQSQKSDDREFASKVRLAVEATERAHGKASHIANMLALGNKLLANPKLPDIIGTNQAPSREALTQTICLLNIGELLTRTAALAVQRKPNDEEFKEINEIRSLSTQLAKELGFAAAVVNAIAESKPKVGYESNAPNPRSGLAQVVALIDQAAAMRAKPEFRDDPDKLATALRRNATDRDGKCLHNPALIELVLQAVAETPIGARHHNPAGAYDTDRAVTGRVGR